MAAIKNCVNRVEARLEHGCIALDGYGPSIQKRRAMVEELRAGVLPGLDARPRFLLLLGLVRDSFPWLYAYGREMLEEAERSPSSPQLRSMLGTFAQLLDLGCRAPVTPAASRLTHDDVLLLRGVRDEIAESAELACEVFVRRRREL